MQNRTPRYRYGFYPKHPGADHASLSIGIRRVDGDPDGGAPLQRTSSDGIGLDELLCDLREMLAALPAAGDPGAARVEPARTWAYEGLDGAFVMRRRPT